MNCACEGSRFGRTSSGLPVTRVSVSCMIISLYIIKQKYCTPNRNKVHNKCNVFETSQNQRPAPTPPSQAMERLSSRKPVPGARKEKDCYYKCSLTPDPPLLVKWIWAPTLKLFSRFLNILLGQTLLSTIKIPKLTFWSIEGRKGHKKQLPKASLHS